MFMNSGAIFSEVDHVILISLHKIPTLILELLPHVPIKCPFENNCARVTFKLFLNREAAFAQIAGGHQHLSLQRL